MLAPLVLFLDLAWLYPQMGSTGWVRLDEAAGEADGDVEAWEGLGDCAMHVDLPEVRPEGRYGAAPRHSIPWWLNEGCVRIVADRAVTRTVADLTGQLLVAHMGGRVHPDYEVSSVSASRGGTTPRTPTAVSSLHTSSLPTTASRSSSSYNSHANSHPCLFSSRKNTSRLLQPPLPPQFLLR